jgi:hypothetical protein
VLACLRFSTYFNVSFHDGFSRTLLEFTMPQFVQVRASRSLPAAKTQTPWLVYLHFVGTVQADYRYQSPTASPRSLPIIQHMAKLRSPRQSFQTLRILTTCNYNRSFQSCSGALSSYRYWQVGNYSACRQALTDCAGATWAASQPRSSVAVFVWVPESQTPQRE